MASIDNDQLFHMNSINLKHLQYKAVLQNDQNCIHAWKNIFLHLVFTKAT